MNHRKPITNVWRGISAAMVVVWLLAQALCAVHCASSKVSLAGASAAKTCCKKSNDSQSADQPALTCLAVKAIAPASQAAADLPDQFQVATLILFAEILSSLHVETPSIDRPAARPDRVIAHEVSLGSAARSHAPPFFA
jgi:hypothetical protein